MTEMLSAFIANIVAGVAAVSSILTLLLIAVGVLIGIAVGAMPGLSPSVGVALVLPVSFYLSPMNALALLVSVYLSANYGGSITAIAINTPGTAGALSTTFDGYPLTKKGKPGLALGTSIFASTIGGIIGTLVLMFFAQPLARFALGFESYEYFALGVLGLTVIAALSGNNLTKGIIASLLGLLLVTVGFDPQLLFSRFSFGMEALQDGIKFIPALIGLFAVSEVFINIERWKTLHHSKDSSVSSAMPKITEMWSLRRLIFKSSIIGALIGSIPGAGSSIASLIAYNEAKRTSQHPDKFGDGSLEGIAAPESSNNASVGGALIPLLSLGIPGSASTAVLLGALMIHRITPGPELFRQAPYGNPSLVYGIFVSLFIANIFMYFFGRAGNRLWIKIISAPKSMIFPVILALSFVGSYAIDSSMTDVFVCFGFGVTGWLMKRADFPVAPVILGLILGKMIEENLRLSLVKGSLLIFLHRPVSLALLCLVLISFLWPLIKGYSNRKTTSEN